MYRRIDHLALHVKDLNRSVEFYERYFGFKKYFQNQARTGLHIAYLKLGDTILELTHRSDGSMSGFHFCLETVSDLKRDGVEVVQPPHATAAREPRETGWLRVVFKGPDGEQIELRGGNAQ